MRAKSALTASRRASSHRLAATPLLALLCPFLSVIWCQPFPLLSLPPSLLSTHHQVVPNLTARDATAITSARLLVPHQILRLFPGFALETASLSSVAGLPGKAALRNLRSGNCQRNCHNFHYDIYAAIVSSLGLILKAFRFALEPLSWQG